MAYTTDSWFTVGYVQYSVRKVLKNDRYLVKNSITKRCYIFTAMQIACMSD